MSDPAQDGDDGAENSPADPLDDGHPPLTTEKGDTVEDLGVFVDAIRKRLSNLEGEVEDLQEELGEEREERRRLEEENKELRDEIEDLDARTDLLRLVEKSDEMTAKQRRVALIQHLQKAAERERERDRRAMASVNYEEALSALKYPDIDRTTIYDDLREAPRLVGDRDVLWYESSSGGESRLKLNLERGDLPGGIVGQPVSNEVE